MRKLAILLMTVTLALAAPLTVLAAEHGDHGGHTMGHSAAAHEEVVNGVKATFTVQTMAEAMKAMKMAMPNGVKETHHISVAFLDVKSGKPLTEGDVTVKVQAPDKSDQVKELMAMQGHFGGDFIMAKKGKYGVMAKFKLKDGQVRSAKFWYEVK
ncbi:MAG TPA: hypothetical protein VIU41_05520 [Geobacteraceae bacterium]